MSSHYNSLDVLSVLQSRLENTDGSIDGRFDHLRGLVGLDVERRCLKERERRGGRGRVNFVSPAPNFQKKRAKTHGVKDSLNTLDGLVESVVLSHVLNDNILEGWRLEVAAIVVSERVRER